MKSVIKYQIFLCILCFISVSKIFSQEIHNLDKYWYYRERLKKQFLVSSPNDQPGTNIPADNRHAAGYMSIEPPNESPFGILSDCLTWSDATIYLSNYISVLATEYRLLKDYSQDVTGTLQELSYAMKAFDRLDFSAETHYTYSNGVYGQANLNGFFIRDDIKKDNDPNNQNTGAILNYPESHLKDDDGFLFVIEHIVSDCGNGVNPFSAEESMDQCWHMLLSLAMVTKLVNDNFEATGSNYVIADFKTWAQEQTKRIVDYMHNCIATDQNDNCISGWNILNPINGHPVTRGSNISQESIITGLNWAFARAGNVITEGRYGPLDYAETLTDYANMRSHFFSAFTTGYIFADNYNARALATIIGNSFLDEVSGSTNHITVYQKLIEEQQSTGAYEHFPLMELVLHGVELHDNDGADVFNSTNYNFYLDLLNEAPGCGPYKDGNLSSQCYSPNWSSQNRLVWPENLGIGKGRYGYYNGLDYMLLHNLFWLVYIDKQPLNDYLLYYDFPVCVSNNCWGSHTIPYTLESRNKIYAHNLIKSDADVTYHARNLIQFLPGFKVEAGANFKATIVGGDLGTQFTYTKANYASTCSLISGKLKVIQKDTIQKEVVKKDSVFALNEISEFPYLIKIPVKNENSVSSINGSKYNILQFGTETTNGESQRLSDNKIIVFPNPSNGEFNIIVTSAKPEKGDIIIQNMIGTNMYEVTVNTNVPKRINISNAAKGVYTINIQLSSKSFTEKIVLQ